MARILSALAVVLLIAMSYTAPASAQSYPERPVTLVVGFAPGGTTDILARILAEKMSTLLKQSVVVENRPGADGNIAAQLVASERPDGHSLLLSPNGLSINVSIYQDTKLDPLTDLAPISLIGRFPNLLVVGNSMEANTISELVETSKSKDLFYAATSSNTSLSTEFLKQSTGLKATRIPYKGAGLAVPALLGNEVQMMVTAPINVAAHLEAGSLRALAITGDERSALYPDVPTFAESGAGSYDDAQWFGLLAPTKTPQEVIDLLNETLAEALADPAVVTALEKLSLNIEPSTPDEFRTLISSDIDRWANLIKTSGITLN
ncbi:MAG: Bug family tripartite tricarboxylate transporter substrate binding protein [Neoaquamicrobium sediminum]|uniref:Bug family tripartite tricarboxylate transporter substrate binding protein n=1 Tax=Neoaquamicrobium sediminum TaxID=1849104 RepID=UPI004035F440